MAVEKVLERYGISPQAYQELMDFSSNLAKERQGFFEGLKQETQQVYTPFGAVTIPKAGVDAQKYQQERAAKEAEFDKRFYDKAAELGVPTMIEGNYGPQALSPGWLTQQMRASGLNFTGAGGQNGESTAGQYVRSVEGERARGDAKVNLGDVLSLAPQLMMGAAGVPLGGQIFGNALTGAAQGQDVKTIAKTAALSGAALAAPQLLLSGLQQVPDSVINAAFDNPVTNAIGSGVKGMLGGVNDALSYVVPAGNTTITNLAQAGLENSGRLSDTLLSGLFISLRDLENREVDIPKGTIQGPSGSMDLPILDYPGAPQTPEQQETPQQGGGGGGSSSSGSSGSTESPEASEAPSGIDRPSENTGMILGTYIGGGYMRTADGRTVKAPEGNWAPMDKIPEYPEADVDEDILVPNPFPNTTDGLGGSPGTGESFWEEMDRINPDNIYSGGTGTGVGTGTGSGSGSGSGSGTGGGSGTGTGSGGLLGGSSAEFDTFQAGITYAPQIAELLNIPLQDYLSMWTNR